jgi:glyoxylase-like metal-dependent hydrolase (beta-lactamase superfamily II)
MIRLYQHYSLYGFANSYLVGDDRTGQALIVDPGEFNAKVLDHIERNGLYVSTVLLTHAHTHHVSGLATLLKVYDAEVYSASASVNGIPCRLVRDGEKFAAAGFSIEALSVPGHSPDSIVYRIDHLLFTGDALHAGLIGRTLSPFNARILAERLRARIMDLDDECLVLPGHGPPSTLGTERSCNLGLEEGWANRVTRSYDFFV